MKNNTAQKYPLALKFFRLDGYINLNTERFIELSPRDSRINKLANQKLKRIEQESGAYAYLHNRLRESIALQVMKCLLEPKSCELSSVVNDLCYGIDAIARFGRNRVYIDFTENLRAIDTKLNKTDNGVKVIPGEQGLPLLVYFVASTLVDAILDGFEHTLTRYQNLDTYTYGLRLGNLIKAEIAKDKLPQLLVGVHMHEHELQGRLRQKMNENIGLLSQYGIRQ